MSALSYRRGSARDRAALEALLSGLSPDSAYSRFQAALGAAPPPAVVDALLPPVGHGETLLAWHGDALVGHGMWVRVGPSRAAEVALVVTDSHQRQGIGTVLAERLVRAACARGIERIEVFSEAGNRAVARLVAHRAPDAEPRRDGLTVTYSIELRDRARMGRAPRRSRAA